MTAHRVVPVDGRLGPSTPSSVSTVFRLWGCPVVLAWVTRYAWLVAAVVVNGAIFAPVMAASTARACHDCAIDVLTFNVQVSNGNVDPIVAYFADPRWDLIAVQETSRDLIPLLAAPLSAHGFAPPIRCPNRLTILSRLPIGDSGAIPLDGPLGEAATRHACWARVTAPFGDLLLVDVHLNSLIQVNDGTAAAAGQTGSNMMRDNLAQQAAHLDALRDHALAADIPVLVVGDFNASAAMPHMAAFLEAASLVSGPEPPPPTRPASFPVFAIDHIFASAGLEIVTKTTGPDLGSDHLPLEAVVRPASP